MRNSLDDKNGGYRRSPSDRMYPVVLIICGGIALSMLAFDVVRRSVRERVENEFELAAKERVTAVEHRLDDGKLLLEALGAFFAGSEHVTREEFAAYVKPFLQHYGCVEAVEWIPRVSDLQRGAYEQGVRAEGFADFQIRERTGKGQLSGAADRGEYFPVHYVEPYQGNELALGFDLASDPVRLEALNLSCDTAQTVATGRIKLVQESANKYGFLVFKPIFRKDASVESTEERRESLDGFVLVVFRVGDLVERALTSLQSDGVHVRVEDRSAAVGKEFLYYHRSRLCPDSPGARECWVGTALQYSKSVKVGGRKWQVICTPADEFLAVRQSHKAKIALIVGLGSTFLLTVCVGLLIRYVDRLAKHAEAQRKSACELQEEVNRRMETESELAWLLDKTGKRVKELTCIHNVTKSVRECETLEAMFGAVAGLIGSGWQYSEIARGKIVFDGAKYVAEAFEETEWALASEILVSGKRRGVIAVYYLEERPLRDEGPFVREERQLIDSIAEIVNRMVERAEAERRNRHLAMIAEQAGEGIAVADLEGTLQFVNDAWAHMHGYEDAGELVGQHLRIFHTVEQLETEVIQFNETASRESRCTREIGHVRKDGTTFPTEMTTTIFRDESGQAVGYIGFATDITERKRAEALLTEARDELADANRQLEVSIEQAHLMAHEATTANQIKTQFLANMSHELRTPLNGVIGFGEILAAEPLNDQQKEYVSIIGESGKHLLALVEDILDYAKLDAGKLDTDIAECSLTELLSGVSVFMESAAKKKGLEFRIVDPGPSLPERIRTDPVRVRQCLINLVGNAIKFTERGYVRVVTHVEKLSGDDVIRFDIEDTGIGVPIDKQSEIFESFTQTDSSMTRKYGGSGLGLAITRHLARLLGGNISVSSEPGQGSVFSLWIPAGVDVEAQLVAESGNDDQGRRAGEVVVEQGAGEQATEQAAEQRDDGQLADHILVAEDDWVNGKLIETVLTNKGLAVTLVENGRQMVDAAMERSFDLILTDIQMPVMNGYEATAALRRAGFSTPIVALTANALEKDVQKCLAAGCDAHLAKPMRFEVLDEILGKYLGVSRVAPT